MFHGPVAIQGRALAYEPYGTDRYRLSIPTHSLLGSTGLYTTIEDLAKWDRNFYDMQVGGLSLPVPPAVGPAASPCSPACRNPMISCEEAPPLRRAEHPLRRLARPGTSPCTSRRRS